jgi:hypothetical protein
MISGITTNKAIELFYKIRGDKSDKKSGKMGILGVFKDKESSCCLNIIYF